MNYSNKRKRPGNANPTGFPVKRSRGAEPFPAPTTLLDESLLEDTYKVAQQKEKEFQELTNNFVVPHTMPFFECLNVLTVFHYWIKVNQEVLICAIDIFYRYLAKCHSAVGDYDAAIRIIAACTLLAAKFCGSDEDELIYRHKIVEKSKLDKKELAEAEKQVLLGIDYRINWWNGSYFIDYLAKFLNYAQDSKEVVLAYLVLTAAHHSRKLQQAKHSLNAAASFAIATEIFAYSGSRGPLKRKRSGAKVFKPNKLPSSSKEEYVVCKRTIIRALRRCKDNGAKVYKLLSRECGSADPVEVLEQQNKRRKL